MKAKKALVLLGVGAILAIGTAASDGGVKIGVVDIDQAISSTEEGKAAREEFARKQRAAQGVVQPLLDRYKALEEEMKAKKFVLSDEALFQKQLDLVEEDDGVWTACDLDTVLAGLDRRWDDQFQFQRSGASDA